MFSAFHGELSGLNANKMQHSLCIVFCSTWNFTPQWQILGKLSFFADEWEMESHLEWLLFKCEYKSL